MLSFGIESSYTLEINYMEYFYIQVLETGSVYPDKGTHQL